MKKPKDLNDIAKIEQAIAAKYGEEAVQNVKANWDEEKEKKYIEQAKALYEKEFQGERKEEKVEHGGFLLNKRLLIEDSNRVCPICEEYSFKSKDDLYHIKYGCCYGCFILYVEGHGREERWLENRRKKSQDEDQ